MNNSTHHLQIVAFLSGATYVTEGENQVTFEGHDSASELHGSNHDQWPSAMRFGFKWETEFVGALPARRA